MSYSVFVLPPAAQSESKDGTSFSAHCEHHELESELEPAAVKKITSRLQMAGWKKGNSDKAGQRFEHSELSAHALLTKHALCLSGRGEDAIFEIGLFASELAAEGGLAKFDPQTGEWE
jgi:hypothetical protein